MYMLDLAADLPQVETGWFDITICVIVCSPFSCYVMHKLIYMFPDAWEQILSFY